MIGLIQNTDCGLYCEAGDFYIDPWHPVDRAVITHAHADHATRGSKSYLTTNEGKLVLRRRMEEGAQIRTIPYAKSIDINGVKVSLHPAGHLLGSAQVRVEHRGEVWVISGDYKIEPDATCTPFEPVPCHTFITESTFGLPIYKWQPQQQIFDSINAWWRDNQAQNRTSVLYAYSLGKAQRVLSGLDPSIGPILVHGSVFHLSNAYRESGIELPPYTYADAENAKVHRGKALLVAPPSANNNPSYLRKFGPASHGFASGWMTIRGARRRRAVDRGFILSDHVDWGGLMETIRATGAERIGVTHGYRAAVTRYLRDNGWDAWSIETRFEGEAADARNEDETESEEENRE